LQPLLVAIALSLLAASTAATIGALASMISDSWRRRQAGLAPGVLQRVPTWVFVFGLLTAQLLAILLLREEGGEQATVLAVGSLVGAAVAGTFAVVLSAIAGERDDPVPAAAPAPATEASPPRTTGSAPTSGDAASRKTRVERCERRCAAADLKLAEAATQLVSLDSRWFLLEEHRDALQRTTDPSKPKGEVEAQLADIEERLGTLADVFRETYRAWLFLGDAARLATLRLVTARLLHEERQAHHANDPERYLVHATAQAAAMGRLAEYAVAEDEHTQRGLAVVLGPLIGRHHPRPGGDKLNPRWKLRRQDALVDPTTALADRRDTWVELATLLRTTASAMESLLRVRGASERSLYLTQRKALIDAIDVDQDLVSVPVPPSPSTWESEPDGSGVMTRPAKAARPTRTPTPSAPNWSATRDAAITLDDALRDLLPPRHIPDAVVPRRVVERSTTPAEAPPEAVAPQPTVDDGPPTVVAGPPPARTRPVVNGVPTEPEPVPDPAPGPVVAGPGPPPITRPRQGPRNPPPPPTATERPPAAPSTHPTLVPTTLEGVTTEEKAAPPKRRSLLGSRR
jgi:hypothetical protein